jgi:hypothetical protein
MHEFVVSDFSSSPATQQAQFFNTDAAVLFTESIHAMQCVIYVAHIVGHVDHGNFYIWRSNDLAHVRLDEHREHYLTDPSRSVTTKEAVAFIDESGAMFNVSPSKVISWAQATEALIFWLRSGSKLPSLSWS